MFPFPLFQEMMMTKQGETSFSEYLDIFTTILTI